MGNKKLKEIERELRRDKAMQMTLAGQSTRTIANKLGVVHTTIVRDIAARLKVSAKESQDKTEEYRELQRLRLEELREAVWPQAVDQADLAAQDRALRLEIREAALLGLDAPKELKHSGAVDLNKPARLLATHARRTERAARGRDQSAACGGGGRRMTVAPQMDMELLTALVNNPDWIEQELAERSLAEFIRQMWTSIDPSPYVANWHIDAIAEHLEAVNRGEISRLIINIPPRHMKSIAVSVAWPAWTWTQQATTPLRGPTVRFLYASYAQSLSIRDSVKCRRVIDSPLYQARWGDRFKWVGDQNTKIRFDNDKKGYRIATSVDGALTGEGGDVIVVDDPHNVTEAESVTVRQAALSWWDESMSNPAERRADWGLCSHHAARA